MTLGNLRERPRHNPTLIFREKRGFVARKKAGRERRVATTVAAAESRIVAEVEIHLPLAGFLPDPLESKRDPEASATTAGGTLCATAGTQALDMKPVARVPKCQQVFAGNQGAVGAAVVREGASP